MKLYVIIWTTNVVTYSFVTDKHPIINICCVKLTFSLTFRLQRTALTESYDPAMEFEVIPHSK